MTRARTIGAAAAVAILLSGTAAALNKEDDWTGRYGRHFTIFLYGKKEPVDDVLEIVPVDEPGAFYFRSRFYFHNSHTCTPTGIAHREGQALVFRRASLTEGEKPCLLSITKEKASMVLHDRNGTCRSYFCGANGELEAASLPLSSRRTITYMDRLRASETYARTLSEHAEQHRP